jgi:uncharacterized membrane protein
MSTYTHAKTLQPRATYLYEKSNVINVNRKGRIISTTIGASALMAAKYIKQPFINRLLRVTGVFMLYRGISGNCPVTATFDGGDSVPQHSPAVNIRTSVLVDCPKEVVYRFWKDLENLPVFMHHLQSVKITDDTHSRWRLKTPGSMPCVEWNAEILEDNGDVLSWRSMPGSMIETAGKLVFEEWPENMTQVDILITYRPPAGYIGTALGVLLQAPFRKMVKEDVENFKHYVEAGRSAKIEIIEYH